MTLHAGPTTPAEDEGGLVAALLLDGLGDAQYLGWPEVRAWKPGSGTIWIHLDRKGTESRRWPKEESGLEDVVIKALLADTSQPNVIPLANGLLINLRGVNTNPGAQPEDMVKVQIWAEEGRIVTSRHRHIAAVHDVREALVDTTLRGHGTSVAWWSDLPSACWTASARRSGSSRTR